MFNSFTPIADNKLDEVVYSSNEIKEDIERLSREIDSFYLHGTEDTPVALVVMDGAFMFAADLIRQCDTEFEVQFVKMKSYEGNARLKRPIMHSSPRIITELMGKHVLIIEDILDSGMTLRQIYRSVKLNKAADIKSCVLIDREEGSTNDAHKFYDGADFTGKTISVPSFVVGYGLDYKGLYRDLPNVHAMEPF